MGQFIKYGRPNTRVKDACRPPYGRLASNLLAFTSLHPCYLSKATFSIMQATGSRGPGSGRRGCYSLDTCSYAISTDDMQWQVARNPHVCFPRRKRHSPDQVNADINGSK